MDLNSNDEIQTACLWKPEVENSASGQSSGDAGSSRKTQVVELLRHVNRTYGTSLADYWDLYDWSCKNYASFWYEFFVLSNIVSEGDHTKVTDVSQPIDKNPAWFPDVKLNYARNLLENASVNDKMPAIYFSGEKQAGLMSSLSFGDLREKVRQFAAGLTALDVKCGDRVGGYMPNCPETVIAMLATASLGAVWSSASPDFGESAVFDRFGQVKPKVLFTVEAVVYNQKVHDNLAKVRFLSSKLPDVRQVIVIPFVHQESEIDLAGVEHGMLLSQFLAGGASDRPLDYVPVPFGHPLFIMFSSGTTGAPKCMVHSVGGTLLKHLCEHRMQTDLRVGDVLFFYTTAGWMMWNWLISALGTGAAIVLYDGSPFQPRQDVLFKIVDDVGVTALGMGAKCYAIMEDYDMCPAKQYSLSSLKYILSTGSPLKPSSFDYVYSHIKKDVIVGSISGGTDIVGCFMGACPLVPVHRNECQVPYLGCAIDCWDQDGNSIRNHRGELVCLKPFPSMPTHFLYDDDGSKYRKAYFSRFPHVWTHGDFCVFNKTTRGIIMLGRSDGTLNPGGVRFGSSELYNIVEKHPAIADSLCVGQPLPSGDERVVLFLKLAPEQAPLTDALVKELSTLIRSQLSARHVPNLMLEVPDVPHTHSGKKVEVAVKRLLVGEEVQNLASIANPECLEHYKDVPQLRIQAL